MPKKTKRTQKAEVLGIVGVGLDNADGHHRLTRMENFVLLGGSQETHERMTDVAMSVNEQLAKRGKRIWEASTEELIEMFDKPRMN